MKKYLFSVPFYAAIGRSLGMLVPYLTALLFGAGGDTDAFFLAFSLSSALVNLLGYLFESILVPYLAEQKVRSGSMTDFANAVLVVMAPAVAMLCFAVWLGFQIWGSLNAGTAGGEIFHEAAQYFLPLTPYVLFAMASAQANSLLYVNKDFTYPALSPLVRSSIVVACMLAMKPWLGLKSLVAGYLAGEFFRCLTGLSLVWKKLHWRPQISWASVIKPVRGFFKDMGFQILAMIAVNVIFFIDLNFAAHLGEGSASLLNYADRLYQVPVLFFQGGFMPVFHSFWSESYYRDSKEVFWATIKKHLARIFAAAFLFSILLKIISGPLVKIAFAPSHLSVDQTQVLTDIFSILVLNLAPSIAYALYLRLLFVMKKAGLFCAVAWAHLSLKIALNFVFISFWGVRGNAVASVCAMSIVVLGLHFYLRRHWRGAQHAV